MNVEIITCLSYHAVYNLLFLIVSLCFISPKDVIQENITNLDLNYCHILRRTIKSNYMTLIWWYSNLAKVIIWWIQLFETCLKYETAYFIDLFFPYSGFRLLLWYLKNIWNNVISKIRIGHLIFDYIRYSRYNSFWKLQFVIW